MDDNDRAIIACVVLQQKQGRTKKDNRLFTEVELADIEGNRFTRRFERELQQDDGVFNLCANPYFISNTLASGTDIEEAKAAMVDAILEKNEKEEETGENEKC